mgnify:CR=1 FL=1
MKFLIIFLIFISNAMAKEIPNIKNIVINKEPKTYDSITFLDSNGNTIKLNDYKGNLVLLNFWATWCTPCKEEMPSLDSLKINKNLDNLKIFPINVGKDNIDKILNFYSETGIQNLNFYFDSPTTLAKKFKLRGIPTSILINKDGYEFAKVIGSINFEDPKFVNWLLNYD